MGKTTDLFKKIRDTKGTFHANMGLIKYRNGVDLTEAEDIKKRWQEYTEELYKKNLHDPDNHDVVRRSFCLSSQRWGVIICSAVTGVLFSSSYLTISAALPNKCCSSLLR